MAYKSLTNVLWMLHYHHSKYYRNMILIILHRQKTLYPVATTLPNGALPPYSLLQWTICWHPVVSVWCPVKQETWFLLGSPAPCPPGHFGLMSKPFEVRGEKACICQINSTRGLMTLGQREHPSPYSECLQKNKQNTLSCPEGSWGMGDQSFEHVAEDVKADNV